MKKIVIRLALAVTLVGFLSLMAGCSWSSKRQRNTVVGALVGTALGGGIGALAGGDGALIGAATGAVGGAVVGNVATRDERAPAT